MRDEERKRKETDGMRSRSRVRLKRTTLPLHPHPSSTSDYFTFSPHEWDWRGVGSCRCVSSRVGSTQYIQATTSLRHPILSPARLNAPQKAPMRLKRGRWARWHRLSAKVHPAPGVSTTMITKTTHAPLPATTFRSLNPGIGDCSRLRVLRRVPSKTSISSSGSINPLPRSLLLVWDGRVQGPPSTDGPFWDSVELL